jgi:hypothetical protein
VHLPCRFVDADKAQLHRSQARAVYRRVSDSCHDRGLWQSCAITLPPLGWDETSTRRTSPYIEPFDDGFRDKKQADGDQRQRAAHQAD